ncbi:MAG: hypothetical protein E7105_07870 [Prevotella sp.]|nr:hypothetical protein [Prevotella sp.]
MKIKNLLITAMLLLGVSSASATITSGYYRIKSYNDNYLTEVQSGDPLICGSLNSDNYAQVWYMTVDGTSVTIRNAVTQKYIQNQTSTSASFMTGDSPFTFTYAEPSSDIYTFKNHNNSWWDGGLHCDGSLKVVFWDVTDEKSKWTIEPVVVDNDELANQQAAMTEASTSQLTTFFTSEACTALKSTYQSMTDEALRTAMSELPATVQDMAIKVKNNSWTTYDGWDKTEKTFRVASYRPYSDHEKWAKILGFSYYMGRLSNPTGIYATAGDYLQVYVGTIPGGQTVKLEVAGTGESSGVTYTLHEGMNSLLVQTSGNCFVFYEVDNTTSGGTPFTALSSYANVDVHIEGGTVQGYFDLTKGDDNDDWAAMTAEASLLTKPTVCLKSSTHVFNLHKDRLIDGLGAKKEIVEMMNVWKDVAEMQDNLIARGDFNDYCNNIYSVTTLDGTGNPHATHYGTNYHEGTNGLFNADQLLQIVGGLWTIAHEQGHNRQDLIKMTGTTEMSNNMFSTAALDWQGRYTSRVYNIQNTFTFFQQGMSWLERLNNKDGDYHLWECLHLYVQLYQYFHQAGYNTNFFPDLYRALRSSPMTIKAGTPVPASEDYLKFYTTCCDVAGLDLTEFFEAYGFFMLPPAQTPQTINDVNTGAYYQEIDDYRTYYIYVNQDMIDAAKTYVAAKGYSKCNLIFIEDRVTAPLATYTGHADGERRQLSNQDNVTAFGQVGTTGQYTTFGITPSAYTYYINANGGLTVQGKGAVGFKLYDGSGNLTALYNTLFFTLPSGTFDEEGLKAGYTLKAAAGDGTDAAMTYDASAKLNTSIVPAVIGQQITKESMLISGRPYLVYYVGNGNSAFLKDTGSVYTGKSDDVATESAVYYFTNDGTGWQIKNLATGKYLGQPTTNANTYIGTADEASAGSWALNFQGNGRFAPSCNGHSLNRSGSNIHPWNEGTAVENQLAIYEVEDVEPLAGLSDLTGDGWYRLRMTAASTYEKLYIQNNSNEQNYNSDRYPLTYQASVVLPTVDDASCFVRIIRNGANVQIQSANGHYLDGNAKAVLSATNVAVSYDTGFKLGDAYLPFERSGNRILGKSSYTKDTRFALYPMSIGGQNLQAWKVSLVDIPDTYWTFSCTRGDAKGLTTIYNNGYIFLPLSLTPTAEDFSMLGMKSCVVDATNKTITATFDESISLVAENTQVIQGNQTTGKGNTMQALLRVKTTAISACTPTSFTINVTGADQLSKVAVYTTTMDEIYAEGASPTKIGETDATDGEVVISVTASEQTTDATCYYWITADMKADATEWDTVDASISAIAYSNANGGNTLDLTDIGNPDGAMRIYKQQQFLWTSSTSTNKYYRIPTIMKTKDGGIVALADYRHDHPNDLGKTASNGYGGHIIDVVSRSNADCGDTWESEVKVAVGDGTNDASYGYGDPAIVRDNDGTLHCLMAAGSKSYAKGMLHMGYSKSTDNGASWSAVTDIYSSIDKGSLTITSAFTTGGKGVTFENGRMAFAFLGTVSSSTNIYPIYSDDKGATWKLGTTAAYSGGDEAKFEIMNDYSLLASVKIVSYNQTGNRGKNSTTGDASGDGISTWNTQGSWDGNMVGNGCNADIIYYSRATEGKRDVMMHTLTKSYNSHRKDLRLYMSFDQGATWAEAFQLQPGWAAYSSMQVLDNGDLAIIYEDGSIGNEDKHDCFAINYVTISKETLKARIAELDGPDVTYHIMFNGNEVASNATPEILLKTADAAIPNALKRAFCTYQYYSDAGLTSEITQVGTYQDVYVKCTSSAPFEFSTEVNPKWYLMYSHEQQGDGDYYSYADGSTYNSAIANTNDICANTAYWWAFIGNPYGVQLLNKGQDAYLSAAATFAGSNGARISSAITRNNGSYPNNTFTVYGYSNANVTTSNPFSLVLNESSYAWVNGADKGSANNTGAILYHSGITFNSSLQLNNWRGANLMVREIPSSFDIALNTVGEASYATLYLPYDVQTDGETKAYYIASANNGYAQLTETNNEGRDIPAKTAVVLINSDAESSAHFSVTSEMSSVVDAEDNLLKGTLTSMELDLSDETPYYSLGRKDGKIGFYKFNNGGTTTITLGANKAYLETAASGGAVKGFTLDFDGLATDIRLTPTDETESSMFEGQSSKIYNIAGQRLNKPMKGINIINGQKIVVK